MSTDSTPERSDAPDGVGTEPSLPADAELFALVGALREADRAMARAVALADRLDGHRAAREEGMTVDAALRLHAGVTRTDVSSVLTAAEVLARMPLTFGLFTDGVLTWGHIRALTLGARTLDVATRRSLDAYLGARSEQLRGLDADGRLGVIDDAMVLHARPRIVEARAERAEADNVVVLTPRLDGTGTLYSDLDPEGFATVTRRLHDEADTPVAPPSPGDTAAGLPTATRTDTTSDLGDAGGRRPSRGRQLADALVRIFACHDRAPASGAPVRFAVLVDADRVTDQIAGTIQGTLAGRAPRLTARALERLTCDAAFDVIVRRGTDLIAAQRYAPEVTAATRRAVAARDQGCRFPSCQAPASWCDVHHVVPRAAGGDHALGNLVLLCRRHHTIVHRRGWDQTLDDTGDYRIRRNRRTWTTRPRTLLPRSNGPPGTTDRVPTGSGRDPTPAGPAGPAGTSQPPSTTDRRTADGRPIRPVAGPGPPEPLPF